MPLANEDIQFIKEHLGEWLAEESMAKQPVVYELELRERSVRVEEQLKHQRELMQQGFKHMEKRFEQVDKRFQLVSARIDFFIIWLYGLSLTVGAVIVIAAFRYYTQAA